MTRTISTSPSPDSADGKAGSGARFKDRLFNVLSHTRTAVATFDAQESCTFCSPLFEEFFHCIPSNIDALVAALSSEADIQHHLRSTFELARSRQDVSKFDVSHVTSSGATRVLSIDAFLFGAGDESELVVIIQDTSGELSFRRDLEQISRLAALGQITAGVAHEFNNIITSILGWSQIASQNADTNTSLTSALEIIEGNARRAKDIVSHLLGVSRSQEDVISSFSEL